MQQEFVIEDDWNPDPLNKDTILNFQRINFQDKQIQKQKQQIENQIYNDQFVKEYAEQNWISDEEEDTNDEEYLKLKKQLMSEQMFYNPLEDCKNENFVNKKYDKQKRVNRTVLNCPNCFTSVCYHCQRHENYKNQYRASITINTKINEQKIIENDLLGVNCKICETEIGIFDVKQRMYHFYNVIPGYG